ncbi:DUF935 domain-containing protein [Rhodococcoides fascians]|uniref:DUF935 domain-containing protein n=1 Tax=Rhodococcoides fascians TaxID=1828 RepID=UPI000AC9FDCC|nr:DUF935 domain-containing protein [Rhodococcus fascians]
MAPTAPAAKPAPPPPLFEQGYVNGQGESWQFMVDDDESTPELRWPESIRTYSKMGREDAQVVSVLKAVMLPVIRTKWSLEQNGSSPEVWEHIAKDLGVPKVGTDAKGKPPVALRGRSKGRFSLKRHLRDALSCLQYGHSFFEQNYRYDERDQLLHLRKLAPRKQNTISKINVALDGGLVSIEQAPPASMAIFKSEPISVNRLVAYVHDEEPGVWTGQSMLRPAYKHWYLKDRLLRVHANMIERNGMGVPIYEGADGASKEDLEEGKKMASAYRSGQASGGATPFGAKLALRGVEGNLPDALPGVKYHDEQIGRAALTHFLNLGQQTGSWALGSEFANFFIMTLQTIAEYLCDILNQHVIEDLVDANWGEDEQAPLLVFEEIGAQNQAVAEALKVLVDAGIIFPDRTLEEWIREKSGLPAKDLPPKATPADTTPPATNRRRPPSRSGDPGTQEALFDA